MEASHGNGLSLPRSLSFNLALKGAVLNTCTARAGDGSCTTRGNILPTPETVSFPLAAATHDGNKMSWPQRKLIPFDDAKWSWRFKDRRGSATVVPVWFNETTPGPSNVYVHYGAGAGDAEFLDWRWRSSIDATWGLKSIVPPVLSDGRPVTYVKLRPAATAGSTVEVAKVQYSRRLSEDAGFGTTVWSPRSTRRALVRALESC